MTLIEERRLSKIRQRIRRSRQQVEGDSLNILNVSDEEPAQLKINLDTRQLHHVTPIRILIEEIGWEAYEWQRR